MLNEVCLVCSKANCEIHCKNVEVHFLNYYSKTVVGAEVAVLKTFTQLVYKTQETKSIGMFEKRSPMTMFQKQVLSSLVTGLPNGRLKGWGCVALSGVTVALLGHTMALKLWLYKPIQGLCPATSL